jgi:WD40 repeat protein
LNNGQGAIWSVAFSPDGLLLVSGSGGISRLGFINGSEDSTVRLWTLDPQPKVKDFWSHGDRVRAVSFSPDEHRVASVGEDRTVHLYHLLTRSHRVSKGHLETLHFLAFSPDGQTIAVGSGGYDAETTSQGKVILWQVQTGRIVQFMFAGTIVNVPVAFSPDGRLLAFPINLLLKGENCSVIKLLRLQTQKAYYLHPPKRLQPSYHPFYSVAFSPDGKRLASSNALGIQIWDVENRKLLWQVNPGNPWGQHNPIVFSPNGEVLACIRAGRLSLWDVHAQVPKPILLLGAGFLSVAFSPDGRAIAAGRKDGTIHLWQCDA